ncbi:formate transporter FocA [Bifidobacterium sp. SMB2]|uniref:Formate transporter FocA n=1 Tax=Bifidobacterium saimiriisciurei TaxID=2661627 RepID=A0ABX0CAI5_9BIFI|nr:MULTISPECIES: formate/nitrite transporter family protein [Bifidobacterium]NEG97078.1 formate transporter FocA [Bifidobacterium sp. SMB2]NEH12146.1 formate transporter FocA [Bifidobacterium saimiriisciurei]
MPHNGTPATDAGNTPTIKTTPSILTPQVNINALTPAETEETVEKAGIGKTQLSGGKAFVSAMFAGAFIGFGALFFLIVTSDPAMTWGPKRFVGGLAFCMGLVLVLCCGAELFTGNSLMASDIAARKISWGALAKNWVIVWFGNLAGALLLVTLIAFAGTMGLNDGAVGDTAVATAASKITPDWITLFFRGILCNILVCLAVRIGFSARSVGDKVLGILLPIAGFVAMGFEHCVANMFFLPVGLVSKTLGFGAQAAGAEAVTVQGILYNLSAATLGNIVGGAIFVALAYWFVNARREPAKSDAK